MIYYCIGGLLMVLVQLIFIDLNDKDTATVANDPILLTSVLIIIFIIWPIYLLIKLFASEEK